LWTHPKIMLTPHAAAHGDGRHLRTAELFVSNLRSYVDGVSRLPDEV
jgi:phosphoglycerate dehydrogenase-like enzyme